MSPTDADEVLVNTCNKIWSIYLVFFLGPTMQCKLWLIEPFADEENLAVVIKLLSNYNCASLCHFWNSNIFNLQCVYLF